MKIISRTFFLFVLGVCWRIRLHTRVFLLCLCASDSLACVCSRSLYPAVVCLFHQEHSGRISASAAPSTTAEKVFMVKGQELYSRNCFSVAESVFYWGTGSDVLYTVDCFNIRVYYKIAIKEVYDLKSYLYTTLFLFICFDCFDYWLKIKARITIFCWYHTTTLILK